MEDFKMKEVGLLGLDQERLFYFSIHPTLLFSTVVTFVLLF